MAGIFDWITPGVGTVLGAGIGMLSNSARNTAETDLANTAHQREVADLKAAGLNPVLSAGGGGSATPALSSAISPEAATATAKQAAMLESEQHAVDANAWNATTQANVHRETAKKVIQDTVNSAKTSQILDQQLKVARLDGLMADNDYKIEKLAAPVLSAVRHSAKSVKDVPAVGLLSLGRGGRTLRRGQGIVDLETGELIKRGR